MFAARQFQPVQRLSAARFPQAMRSYATSDKFSEKEQGEEAVYVKQQEQAKLKELKAKAEQQQKDLSDTQNEINKAEKKSAPGRSLRRLRGVSALQHTPKLLKIQSKLQSTQPHHSTDLIYNYNKRTLLPTPRPNDDINDQHSSIYPTSDNQELFAILEACLSSPFLLDRAQGVFQNLRDKQIRNYADNNYSTLDVTIYNKFIERYFQEADNSRNDKFIGEAFKLWNALCGDKEGVKWELETWTLMLKGMARHLESTYSSKPLLDAVKDLPGKPSLRDVIVKYDHFTSLSESFAAVAVLTRAAATAGNVPLIEELAEIHSELERSLNGHSEDNMEPDNQDTPTPTQEEQDIMGVKSPSTSETPYNLYSLRQSLKPLGHTSKTLAADPAARQRLLEESAYETAKARFEHEMNELEKAGVATALSGQPLQKLMWEWWKKLSVLIGEKLDRNMHLETHKTKEDKFINEISPFLSLLSSEKMALITVLEILRLSGTGGIAEGMKTTRALLSVGKAVENEHHAEILKSKHGVSLKGVEADAKQVKRKLRYFDHKKAEKELDLKSPEFTGLIDEAMGTSTPDEHFAYPHDIASERALARVHEERMNRAWTPNWSQMIRIKVGSFLVDSLMECATITRIADRDGEEIKETQPAFSQSYQYVRGRKLGVIKVNTVVADRLDKDPLGSTIHPRHLPMLVKPKPWLRYDNGGYLFHKNFAMRFKDSNEQQSYIAKASNEGTMEPVLAGLDVLGQTPWNVNQKVFAVVKQAWNSGEGVAKIPPATTHTPDPIKPSNYESDPKQRSNYLISMKAVVNERRNNHSIRCDTNYKLEIAKAFLNETFYFPHTLDFRGRAYPIPPHLNHIGDDLSRGLLKFAETRPLGEKGMRWLKIHLANVYGYDKASFNERENFADEHLADIYDSADRPLDGRGWWLKADDPWQCLAACYEIQAALESSNPLAYESSLPVHQDGTCNGLQHYAALGGDPMGAKQVNLEQADRPSDVYTAVADLVIADIRRDAQTDDNAFAKLLEGKITRKVVKQTVMTTVYGVTFIGARDQIDKQLQDRGDIPRELIYSTASYLAKKVLRSIGDLFSGANAIQKWLSMSARYVSKSIPPERLVKALEPAEGRSASGKSTASRTSKEQMTSVIWTTPLGLPIVQPYRKAKKKQIATLLQSVYLADPNLPTEVNPIKQASAFPPNFIHSLDATHMILTALQCCQIGITYASVHDSYWTHASTVDHMSEIIRDTFVKLHCEEILKRLRDEVVERYKGYRIPMSSLGAKIDKENPKLNSVLPTKKKGRKSAKESEEMESENEMENESESDNENDHSASISKEDLEAIELIKSKQNTDIDQLSQDEQLSDFIKSKYIKLEDALPDLPSKGPFDVRGVVNSPYFFS
ncbi:hypothetical protein E3P92_00234 [Wallemia ichthyophaga]|nr:hypothetical protein E3P98_00378 [Wallemia ichthyophaga]TIB00692.1 hypothetical protein E3P95_01554 [Wallemia ichthyophaga]TIB01039.1 hypothetical protein E3P94_01940 [Wallemia ichthyophaga]TIB19023.1 hypothetical protein E3P92_00234 [Wallemia ichthyophaga]TIB37267.1 hypothetical protein E3P84_00396 [Wallemia ichthyophaga]